jgi:hypothetical protein
VKFYSILIGSLFLMACENKVNELSKKWVHYNLQKEACKRQSRHPFSCNESVQKSIDFDFLKFENEMEKLRENPAQWKSFQDSVIAHLEKEKKKSVKPIKPKKVKKKQIKKDSMEKKND